MQSAKGKVEGESPVGQNGEIREGAPRRHVLVMGTIPTKYEELCDEGI